MDRFIFYLFGNVINMESSYCFFDKGVKLLLLCAHGHTLEIPILQKDKKNILISDDHKTAAVSWQGKQNAS